MTGADYLSIREVVNITVSQKSTCYTIPILGDDKFEGNETFSVVLTLNANVSGVQESYDEATVIIVDDDGKYFIIIIFCYIRFASYDLMTF